MYRDSPSDTDVDSPTEIQHENELYDVVEEQSDNEPEDLASGNKFFVYYLASFATIGGLLFGYDTGIVSGAMLLIEDFFDLSSNWFELIVSGTVGAAAVFSLLAGFVCDLLGRKITIMMASLIFTGGGAWMALADSKEMLFMGRIIVGIAIGFASMVVPVYVAEASPPAIRGVLVTLNQLFITIGILVSSIIAGALSSMEKTGWRWMLGLSCVPGLIQFVGFFYLPESPRWLVSKGRDDQARKVLQRIRARDNVEKELKEIHDAVMEDKKLQGGFVLGRVMKTRHVRKALFVGCGLQLFQQLCGINTVIYYSATILRMAGFSAKDAIWLVTVPNSINFLATFIGLAAVERLGRKKLLIISFMGVVFSLAVLAIGFQLMVGLSPEIVKTEDFPNGTEPADPCYNGNYKTCQECIENDECGFCYVGDGTKGSCVMAGVVEDEGAAYGRCKSGDFDTMEKHSWSHGYCPSDVTWMTVVGLALFVFSFAPGLGPMPWTINAEIYPMWARGTCISIATGTNWCFNLIVSFTFLKLTAAINSYGAFWLYGGVCFLGMLFTIVFVPETKDKTLEEVEQLFMGKEAKQSGDEKMGNQEQCCNENMGNQEN